MYSKPLIGCLTIGQSPRPDIVGEMKELLLRKYLLVEAGALDGLSDEQLLEAEASDGEAFYVTLLRNGTEVHVSEHALERLLEAKIKLLERRGADLAVLLCTGEFPPLKSAIPFFRSSEIVKEQVLRAYRDKKIAVVIPSQDQKDYLSSRWAQAGVEHDLYDCLPYRETEQCRALCASLRESDADFIVLDCIGFTLEMARIFRQLTGKRVLLSREMICEYLDVYLRIKRLL